MCMLRRAWPPLLLNTAKAGTGSVNSTQGHTLETYSLPSPPATVLPGVRQGAGRRQTCGRVTARRAWPPPAQAHNLLGKGVQQAGPAGACPPSGGTSVKRVELSSVWSRSRMSSSLRLASSRSAVPCARQAAAGAWPRVRLPLLLH